MSKSVEKNSESTNSLSELNNNFSASGHKFLDLLGSLLFTQSSNKCPESYCLDAVKKNINLTYDNTNYGDNIDGRSWRCYESRIQGRKRYDYTCDILRAIVTISTKLRPLGVGFSDLFDDIEFRMVTRGLNGSALTTGDGLVEWDPENTSIDEVNGELGQVVVHELGHIFSNKTNFLSSGGIEDTVIFGQDRIFHNLLPDLASSSNNYVNIPKQGKQGGVYEPIADYFMYWVYDAFTNRNDDISDVYRTFIYGDRVIIWSRYYSNYRTVNNDKTSICQAILDVTGKTEQELQSNSGFDISIDVPNSLNLGQPIFNNVGSAEYHFVATFHPGIEYWIKEVAK